MMTDEDVLRMFMSEAKIAAQLRHENVVTIGGFGEADGVHCLSMEYVFGVNLAEALLDGARTRQPLSVGALLSIIASICDGLDYAHQLQNEQGEAMGIVHRDVTPHNILIGFNGTPKLADFGIAKAVNRGWETTAGIVKGKFCYMSPEQALGKKIDARSDIFSLGIVLWEALTGRELFTGNSPLQIFNAIREAPILPPSRVSDGLSPIVDDLVLKALRRGPTMRFQTAGEMSQAIRDLLASVSLEITQATISQELATIYGDLIVRKALSLRQAMSGQVSIDELCAVMGADKVVDSHLPASLNRGDSDIYEEEDPFGFLDDDVTMVSRDKRIEESVLPARPEIELSGQYMTDPSWDEDLEATVIQIPAPAALQEIRALEPEVDEFDIDIDESVLHEWDDSHAEDVAQDELLSLISEENAGKNQIPAEFTGRFGPEFVRALRRNSSITLTGLEAIKLTDSDDLIDKD